MIINRATTICPTCITVVERQTHLFNDGMIGESDSCDCGRLTLLQRTLPFAELQPIVPAPKEPGEYFINPEEFRAAVDSWLEISWWAGALWSRKVDYWSFELYNPNRKTKPVFAVRESSLLPGMTSLCTYRGLCLVDKHTLSYLTGY